MTAREPPNPETLPRDRRERLGQYWPTMAAIGAGFVIGGLSRGGACDAPSAGCVSQVAVLVGAGFALLAIGFWAVPGGEALKRRRSALLLFEPGERNSVLQTPPLVAKPIGPPQPSTTVYRTEDGEVKRLAGMECPRCGTEMVWDAAGPGWWCPKEEKHL